MFYVVIFYEVCFLFFYVNVLIYSLLIMFNLIYDVIKGNYYSLFKNSKCELNLMFI